MKYEAAQKLSGMLYGNILHRNADEAGYEYYMKTLIEMENLPSDIIYEFFTSDEFTNKFVVNQTPNELARNLLCSFFNLNSITSTDVKTTVISIINTGLPYVIKNMLEDHRFFDRHGNLGIPKYVENVSLML